MPMFIDNAVHLHTLLSDPQAHFKLVGDRLATESRFMHALKNFFLTRNAIQARNQQLHAKMADILKGSKMTNLAESFLTAVGSYRESGKHLMSADMRSGLAQDIKEAFVRLEASAAAGKKDIPEGVRDAAARLVALRLKDMPLAEARAAVDGELQSVLDDPVLAQALDFCHPRDAEEMEDILREVSKIIPNTSLRGV